MIARRRGVQRTAPGLRRSRFTSAAASPSAPSGAASFSSSFSLLGSVVIALRGGKYTCWDLEDPPAHRAARARAATSASPRTGNSQFKPGGRAGTLQRLPGILGRGDLQSGRWVPEWPLLQARNARPVTSIVVSNFKANAIRRPEEKRVFTSLPVRSLAFSHAFGSSGLSQEVRIVGLMDYRRQREAYRSQFRVPLSRL